jgi:hypothetical protein
MSLILKNRTSFNSLYELDKTCFTKQNSTDGSLPFGVLGGTVAALKDGASYTVVPADGTNRPVGLFVNDAAGHPFDNNQAIASNKIAICQKMASVEVDIYADVTFAIGDKLYADANGYLTNVKGTDETVIGYVTKTPTASDPFLGLEMSI